MTSPLLTNIAYSIAEYLICTHDIKTQLLILQILKGKINHTPYLKKHYIAVP